MAATRKEYEGIYRNMATALRLARKTITDVYLEPSAELRGYKWVETQMLANFRGAPAFDEAAFLAEVNR